jgi:hypothetical protein
MIERGEKERSMDVNMKSKKWIMSPWTISIVTTIFGVLLTILYDFLKDKPILTTIIFIFITIRDSILFVLNINLRLWWIILLIIIILVLLYFKKINKIEPIPPDYTSYRSDKFKKWEWSWNWRYDNSKNIWVINDLTAYCPNCGTPLSIYYDYIQNIAECPRCEYKVYGNECEDPEKIEKIIIDNVKRKINNK